MKQLDIWLGSASLVSVILAKEYGEGTHPFAGSQPNGKWSMTFNKKQGTATILADNDVCFKSLKDNPRVLNSNIERFSE